MGDSVSEHGGQAMVSEDAVLGVFSSLITFELVSLDLRTFRAIHTVDKGSYAP